MKPLAISCGLKGRYKLIVRRNDGSVRLETDWFDNLITNQGLNRIGTGGIVTHCQAGSGSSTPLVTDTELQSFIGSTAIENATETGFSGSTPYYQWIRKTFRFDAGVAGQSTEEFEGTLKAVEQIMSKQKIQAEELTGQLGDRLAGAFSIATRAAGLTTAEFTKMMEQGNVSAEYLINIARELGNTYTGADKAALTLAAAQARFETASFLFKKALAENGFAETFTDFLNKLTALLNSEQGAELAKGLGPVLCV